MKKGTVVTQTLLGLLVLTSLSGAQMAAADNAAAPTYSAVDFIIFNDNPFLNLIPGISTDDDFGYTYGIALAYSQIRTKGLLTPNERWTVAFRTDLYTQDLTPPGQDLFPDVPQKFMEVSMLKLTWDNLFDVIDGRKIYYVAGVGIGLMNNERDSGFLAAGQQRAWHTFKHNHLTPDTTPIYANEYGDTYQYFPTAKLALGHAVAFSDQMRAYHCEADRFKIEGGAEFIDQSRGSYAYALADLNKPLTHLGRAWLDLDAQLKGNVYQTADKNLQGYLGLALRWPQFSLRTGLPQSESHAVGSGGHAHANQAGWPPCL